MRALFFLDSHEHEFTGRTPEQCGAITVAFPVGIGWFGGRLVLRHQIAKLGSSNRQEAYHGHSRSLGMG